MPEAVRTRTPSGTSASAGGTSGGSTLQFPDTTNASCAMLAPSARPAATRTTEAPLNLGAAACCAEAGGGEPEPAPAADERAGASAAAASAEAASGAAGLAADSEDVPVAAAAARVVCSDAAQRAAAAAAAASTSGSLAPAATASDTALVATCTPSVVAHRYLSPNSGAESRANSLNRGAASTRWSVKRRRSMSVHASTGSNTGTSG